MLKRWISVLFSVNMIGMNILSIAISAKENTIPSGIYTISSAIDKKYTFGGSATVSDTFHSNAQK